MNLAVETDNRYLAFMSILFMNRIESDVLLREYRKLEI